MNNHYKTALKTIEKEKLEPDCVYGHFIYQNGLTAARIGARLGIPSFCAVGENSTRLSARSIPYSTGIRHHGWSSVLSQLTGVVSVSEYNLELLRANGFIGQNMSTLICPNGVDKEIFHPGSQSDARKRLGLPQDEFIVAFTGAFSERKGVNVLCEALNQCEDVYSIFMGKGPCQPNCRNMVFSGSVPNEKLPDYLNAADVFALLTLGEGCCNAIIEALACGKPVISSGLPFNKGILDCTNSILVDPTDSRQIATAIMTLKSDTETLSKLSLHQDDVLDIKERAKNILNFIAGGAC